MELDQLIVRLEADTRPLSTALASVNREADKSLTQIAKLGERIGGSFVSAALRGENLGSVVRNLARDLAAVTLRDTVINPIGGLLGSLVGGLFGRAGGGSVSKDVPYLVGERGPELFVPSASGRIDPAGGSAASGEGGGVSVNIHVDARGAEPGAAERLRQVAGEIEARTFNAVFAAMDRGGRYARISGRR